MLSDRWMDASRKSGRANFEMLGLATPATDPSNGELPIPNVTASVSRPAAEVRAPSDMVAVGDKAGYFKEGEERVWPESGRGVYVSLGVRNLM